MPHVTLNEMLSDARAKGYGIPCVSGWNQEMVIGHIQAAEAKNAPIILSFTPHVVPAIPIELGIPLIVNAAQRSKVPVASILDHGPDFDSVIKAIYCGASSVMFDGSNLPFEENVRITREIVKVAHAVGVSVEGELGSVGGSVLETGYDNPDSIFTDPRQAAAYASATGIDALALSFGNAHGLYQGEPNLDLPRVRKIAALVAVPLVMHGASGLADEQYPFIIQSGISKINYYSAMGHTVGNDLGAMLAENGKNAVYHQIINRSIEDFCRETCKILDLFGAAGRAGGGRQG